MKNRVLSVTFCVSILCHFPLYSAIGNYYFSASRSPLVPKSNPTFVYQPMERITPHLPVPTAPERVVKITKPVTRKEVPKKDSKKRKEDTVRHEDGMIPPLSGTLPQKLPEQAVSQIIPPTADDVDLSNSSIREAFYTYYELLSALIARFAVYPETARLEKREGIVYVSFLLNKNGSLSDVVLRQSSGFGILDRSALSSVQNAAPFPPLPLELKKETLRVNVPISFEID
jgi:protein TonB